MAQQNLKQKEEVDSLRSKLTGQIKNLEIARDFAIQVSSIEYFNEVLIRF